MIDWSQVKQLEQDVGEESFGEVVEMFLDEVEETVDKLRDAPAGDVSNLAADLHFLKGSALNLGFKVFADLCASGEKTASGGNANSVDLSEVVASYDDSKIEFLAEISQHSGYSPG